MAQERKVPDPSKLITDEMIDRVTEAMAPFTTDRAKAGAAIGATLAFLPIRDILNFICDYDLVPRGYRIVPRGAEQSSAFVADIGGRLAELEQRVREIEKRNELRL